MDVEKKTVDFHSSSENSFWFDNTIYSKMNTVHHLFRDADSTPHDELEAKYSDEELRHTRTLLLTGKNVAAKRNELRDYFHRTFTLYESLFECLASDSTFFLQPEKLRHPLIFYFGHTATFFINKLILAKLINKRINPQIESTCAVGVDEMSWDDLNSAHYEWPTVDALRKYRDQVRCVVDDLILSMQLTLPITWSSPAWVILMGIEHERIHLETSSVLFRQLPISEVKPHRLFPLCPTARTDRESVPENYVLRVPQGKVTTAKAWDADNYGWDNEYGEHTAEVASFEASAFLVSNAEFYEFVVDGGYSDKKWWTEDGWQFVTYKEAIHPVFWTELNDAITNGDTFGYRSMCENLSMRWDWPVDVNYMEAKAFCNWKAFKTGKQIRLPTEDEWRRLRDVAFPEDESKSNDQPHWLSAPGNINLEHYASSSPIDMFKFKSGFYDVIGNVWQHTETPISGFPGFKFHPLYDDFSVPTFDTRHNIIAGGSWISTGNEATKHARYAFRRHFYQHAGFRYVISALSVRNTVELFLNESDHSVSKIIHSQFNASHPIPAIENFASRIADIALDAVSKQRLLNNPTSPVPELNSACDLGCGVGRTSFELARQFKNVTGIDNTTRMIRVAHALNEKIPVHYKLPSEGELESFHQVDETLVNSLLQNASGNIEFYQSDACNLDGKHGNFDLVVVANLIEHLNNPALLLENIHERIRLGGILLIASTYNWDISITARENWLGGKKENTGESLRSLDGIEQILRSHFVQCQDPVDVPIITHNTSRTFTYGTSEVSVWRKTK